jgi:DNA polymerase V
MIGIADCNSFYCSCERLFRPDLNGKPVVVLSNNDGCIVSRTDEAKKLGIDMAVPYFQCKEEILRNNVTVFSSNYFLYGDMSWRVMEIFKQIMGDKFAEVYSVDEAFLDFSLTPVNEIYDRALHLKKYTELCTGIPICVGVAPNKLLAKLANKLAKKNKIETKGVMVLSTPEQIADALMNFDVADIWGIGGRSSYRLKQYGIDTAWKLRNLPLEWFKKNFGGVVGERIIRQLRGEAISDMKPQLEVKKVISTTRSFGKNVTELKDLEQAIATFTARAAEKLRRQFGAASEINVFLVYQEQNSKIYEPKSTSHYTTLPTATSDSIKLISTALNILRKIYFTGRNYKKAGVTLSKIVSDTSLQGNLFEPKISLNRNLMNALDNINFSMKEDTVTIGTAGINKYWKMRQEQRSPKYTTDIKEIRKVE